MLDSSTKQTISEKFPESVQAAVGALFDAATKIKPKSAYEADAEANPNDSLAALIACC